MFLSSTVQSPSSNNPSSSSNLNHSSDDLVQSNLSTFSIRDYASSYRTKNIKKSWPFSSTSLQLCLRHGLSDPLPPIQPSEALLLKKPTHVEKALSYKRKSEKLSSNQITKESFENGLFAASNSSGSRSKIQVVNKNPRKKIGLVVKLGTCVNSGSKEDQSCLATASESMGLRTCPICKTFSSASNTTLNAHIDQCLSVDTVQQPVSKPSKPRVKPRMKLKTMVDIYESAKGCTLEDLDKRNGTKWAMISSYSNRDVSDDKLEESKQGKKRSVLRVRNDDDAPGIGPVYIDAKGQKLRILSEFNKKSCDPSREREDVSEKKSSSTDKRDKSFRKRLREKKHKKHGKLVPQSRKLAVRKGNASEIPQARRGSSEGSRGMERSEAPGPDQRRIFNQRMLTKSRLLRNGDKKGTSISDQPSENGHSLPEDRLVLRGSSHMTTDSSDTDSSPLNSLSSWRVCGESQVSGNSWALSRRKTTQSASFVSNPLRCSLPAAGKVFASKAKGVMKLKKALLDFSENEDEDEEDTGKWESEMTQDCELTDYDDWNDHEETDRVVLNGEDNDYESYEEIDDNKGDDNDDMLDKTDDVDAEFESMVYEQTGCETAERGSSFIEVDPIPIPGPPGSFLPSPWDMGTDATETHGNSSAITSQVHSSQDQLDLTDRNSSASPVSTISNFAAPETHTLFHNINTIMDKRPSRFKDIDQSCCCQSKKEKAFEDTTLMQPPLPHMVQQDLDLLSKSVSAIPSNSNPVLRLMGKDLMVINQREEEPSLGISSLTPTSQFQDLSKTQQHHSPFGGNGLYFNTNTSFYNIP